VVDAFAHAPAQLVNIRPPKLLSNPSPKRRVRWGSGALALTLALVCGHASAQEAERARPVAEGAVVITDGAAIRRQPATSALIGLLHDARLLTSLERAWQDLSSTMNLEQSVAFDRLLGRRVAIFLQQDHAGDTDWAVASQVDPETEALVRERLKPAPRGFVGGAPVLALENGAFELAVPRDSGGGLPTLVLGPRQGDLFDRLVPKGATPPAPPARDAEGQTRGDVFAVFRKPVPGGVAEFASATAWAQGLRWKVSYSGTRSLLLGDAGDERSPAAPLVDEHAWEMLSRGAALAFAGQSMPEVAGVGALGAAWRQLIGVQDLPTSDGSAVLAVLHEPDADAGWRLAFALPIAIDHKLEDGGLGDQAFRGDEAIARGLAAVGPAGALPTKFDRRDPGAIRASTALGSDAKPGSTGSLLSGTHWAWTYASAGDRAWWIVSIVGRGKAASAGEARAAEGVKLLRDAILAPTTGQARPDLFRLFARPEALVGGLVSAGMPEVGLVSALRRAESLSWRCVPGAPGLAEGEITLDLRSPAQP